MGCYFYFLLVGSRRNECNSFWGEKGKGTEGCGLFWCHFHFAEPFSSFTDDKMIPQAITLHNNFIIILSQYIIFLFWRDIFRTSSRLLISPLYLPKDYWIHSRRAKTQKIKRIDHNKCNVRASKNAEQAFSTQWYLYICYGLFFLFSFSFPAWIK